MISPDLQPERVDPGRAGGTPARGRARWHAERRRLGVDQPEPDVERTAEPRAAAAARAANTDRAHNAQRRRRPRTCGSAPIGSRARPRAARRPARRRRTRPRTGSSRGRASSSSTIVWTIVLVAAICTISDMPTDEQDRHRDPHRRRELERDQRRAPRPSAQRDDHAARPSDRSCGSRGRARRPARRTPAAPIRMPSVCGPPCSVVAATAGSSGAYAPPSTLVDREQEQHRAHQRHAAHVAQARRACSATHVAGRARAAAALRDAHREQRRDHREVARRVDREAPALADQRRRAPPRPPARSAARR